MYTTLNRIRKLQPYTDGWETLLKYLGKTEPDDEPLPLLTILDAAGFEYTLECFLAVDGFKKEKQLLAITYAREVQDLMPVKLKEVLDVFERYANGLATQEEFETAFMSAARAAAAAAYATAAWAAAHATVAAHAAARAAARDAHAAAAAAAAAWAAARADVAAAAAADAARSTIKAKQENQLRQLLEKTCTNVTIENSKH